MGYVSIFLLGLLSGVHCIAMCGNIVFGYFLKKQKSSFAQTSLYYHTGRLLSYTAIGTLLGAVGKVLNLKVIQPYALFVASIVLLFLALKQLGLKLSFLNLSFKPVSRFFDKTVGAFYRSGKKGSAFSPFLLGILTGFMPCTPLQAAQLYAATTGSPFSGGLAMFLFGIGNMPFLLLYGGIASRVSKINSSKVQLITGIIILLLAVVVLDQSLVAFGSKFSIKKGIALVQSSLSKNSNSFSAGKDEVTLYITNVSYDPQILTIPANKPVRLIVKRNENIPCSDELLIPELRIRTYLKPYSETVIDLPPLKPGIYRMTCQMYMMEGYLRVVENN